jgi:DNA adenine methylase
MSTVLRPPLKYHGGKFYAAGWIVPLLPPHDVYVEPFAGGLNVLLRKPTAQVEIVGDLNGDLIGFYLVLRDRTKELIARLQAIPYSLESFAWACAEDPTADQLEQAVRFIVKARMSRGGLGRSFAWSERLRGGQPGDKNGWETSLKELPRIARRLQGVELGCENAVSLIRRCDCPGALHYCDPPYPGVTRSATKAYGRFEMSDEDHVKLLDVVLKLEGMVVISGRPNRLYDEALADWKRHEKVTVNHSGQGKTKKREAEVLWLSPTCNRFRLV